MARRPIPKAPATGDYVIETNPNIFFNVGGPFDIMSASFVNGSRGEVIINGGYGGMTGITGEANMGKTTLMAFFALNATYRYGSYIFQYDAEGTGTAERIVRLANNVHGLEGSELLDEATQQYFRTDSKVDGPSWHTGFVGWAKEASGVDTKKPNLIDTPMTNRRGDVIKDYRKHTAIIDSITYFKTNAQVDKVEDIEAGDSKKNTFYMNMGATQQDVLVQANLAASRYGVNYLVAAHSKKSIRMDKYEASPSQLKGLKTDHRIKGGGNAIVDLPNNFWYIRDKFTLTNSSSDKTPKFPSKESLQAELDPDLQRQVVQNLRGKSGVTDLQFDVALSQSNGILIPETNYLFLLQHKKYGLLEHTTNRIYSCALLPETKWQRTTLRTLTKSDYTLRKALQYTMEMCYASHHLDIYSKLVMEPEVVYKTLVNMGYDWNVLLADDVREWWCYREDEEFFGDKFLSSIDLLRMARGVYIPYWFTKEQKAAIDLSKAEAGEYHE